MDDVEEILDLDSDEEGNIDDCTFVKLVECRPWLYDSEHSKYKNNMFKEETWRLISNAMGWENDESEMTGAGVARCKSTWKRLRDNFMRALRRLPSGAGPEEIDSLRKKPIYDALMFLRKVKDKNTRKSSSNFKKSAPAIKKHKVSSPSVPREQWNELIIINENDNLTEDKENQNGEHFTQGQSPKLQSPELVSSDQPGFSGATRKLNVGSSPLPFEATIKHPPPKRINPPTDTHSKKRLPNSTNLRKCSAKDSKL
ncbi:unnamed protein product [Phaedon cochleariae]|uniref:MADF domain-containing protein n=1 Tax=Phaedon cochleariae TaxID=80249 RepID=A0A9P0DWU2_PHACE|nr:unnamed protein product [Phaedon cochleariae]